MMRCKDLGGGALAHDNGDSILATDEIPWPPLSAFAKSLTACPENTEVGA